MAAPRAIFTLGAEARLSSPPPKNVDGEPVHIPPHWTVVVSFAGVDDDGVFSMHSVLSGVDVDAGAEFKVVARAIDKALRHYPLDGRDITVSGGRAVSRVDPSVTNRLKAWRLWVPAAEALAVEGEEDQIVDGRVTGWGIGIEMKGGVGYIAPYLAVQVQEEQRGGATVPLVVPARTIPPFHPDSRPDPGTRMREFVPALFGKLRERAGIGARARVLVASKPPHYSLDEVYEDTALGVALHAAGKDRAAAGR